MLLLKNRSSAPSVGQGRTEGGKCLLETRHLRGDALRRHSELGFVGVGRIQGCSEFGLCLRLHRSGFLGSRSWSTQTTAQQSAAVNLSRDLCRSPSIVVGNRQGWKLGTPQDRIATLPAALDSCERPSPNQLDIGRLSGQVLLHPTLCVKMVKVKSESILNPDLAQWLSTP